MVLVDLRNIFIEKLGNPVSEEKLKIYLDFVKDNIFEGEEYSEVHHILPRSLFEDYVDEKYNLVRLKYSDHVKAHYLLVEAYPIRKFLRPLNYMLDRNIEEYKSYRKLLSESLKVYWRQFKETQKYEEWRDKKSKSTSKVMKDWLSKELSDRRYSKDGALDRVSEQFKKNWENEEIRNRTIESLKKYHSSEEGRKRSSESSQLRWDNISLDEKQKFNEIMQKTNSNIDKRLKNSNTAKENWKDENWANRQKELRIKTKEQKIELGVEIKTNSSKLKEKWSDPEWKRIQLEKQRIGREKKKNETN